MRNLMLTATILAATLAGSPAAQAGRIVLTNDEWTLSNFGFLISAENDPGRFATNVAGWFTGGVGRLHAYSNNFGLVDTLLRDTMAGAGHAWTTGTVGFDFTLANLLTYDGIFLAADAADNGVLIQYVEAGGNVYLAGGTGEGGAVDEAARWQAFLNHFGLGYGTFYNGVEGNIAITSAHPIFAGVDHLYQNNGNDTLDIQAGDPRGQVLVSLNDHGLYAVFDSTAVPEPASVLLLGAGLVTLGFVRRRRNR
jgi:hypothetical protein